MICTTSRIGQLPLTSKSFSGHSGQFNTPPNGIQKNNSFGVYNEQNNKFMLRNHAKHFLLI